MLKVSFAKSCNDGDVVKINDKLSDLRGLLGSIGQLSATPLYGNTSFLGSHHLLFLVFFLPPGAPPLYGLILLDPDIPC